MNKEIKEILEIQEDSDYKRLSIEDILLLKEYIEKLKKENARLKETVENLTTMTVCGDGKQIKQTAQYKLDIAQQRIDKAIEDIDALLNGSYEEINGDSATYYHLPKDCCIERLEIIKKDLLGSDKE